MNNACDAPGLLPIEQAMQLIAETIKPVEEINHCNLSESLGRVIANEIISPINVPAYDNSAMDGYAIRYDDLQVSKTLIQVGKSFAGNSFDGTISQGECVRIMTGAQIPLGADTVVMQENTTVQGDKISFQKVTKGEAIRPSGDDIKRGASVFKVGSRISAVDIGLLASLGFHRVPVFRKLRVAVFSTGDELLAVGESPRSDRIFDTNRPMLVAMLATIGADVIDMGIIADDKTQIKAAFENANQQADCVITSGGVSVGEADYTRDILQEYGTVEFWKLAIKPGKPLAFGRLPNSIFFGLPGNPVSAAVTFDQIVAPALALLSGSEMAAPIRLPAYATSNFKKRPGRTDYQRAHFFVSDKGQICVAASGSQSSGVLSCFSMSNCYAVLEKDRGHVSVGELVQILPFNRIIR